MLVQSAALGPVEIQPEHIFQMPQGLYGFEDQSEFALVTKQEDDITLMWYQAVADTVPCFVVFSPSFVVENFQPELEPQDLKHLGVATAAELEFLAIAVVPDDFTKITLNLKSPIAINPKTRIARQIILANTEYSIRHPLFPETAEQLG